MCGAAAGAIDQDQQARGRLFILIAVSSLTDSRRNTERSNYGDCRPNGCWPDYRSPFFEMLIPFEENRIPNTQIKKNNKRLLPMTLILLCALNPTTTMLATPALPGQDNQRTSSFNSCRANQSFEATMFAVTLNNTLLNFNPGVPGVINSALGVTTNRSVGFDIVSPSNAAFASLTAPNASQSQFFTINLTTGAATPIAMIGVNETVHDIAIGRASQGTGADVCLQDDDSGDILQFNSCAGDYQFNRCGAGGFTLIGRGEISRVGNLLTLQDSKVSATVDVGPIAPRNTASAVIKRTPLGPTFLINDSDTTNNTCSCR